MKNYALYLWVCSLLTVFTTLISGAEIFSEASLLLFAFWALMLMPLTINATKN